MPATPDSGGIKNCFAFVLSKIGPHIFRLFYSKHILVSLLFWAKQFCLFCSKHMFRYYLGHMLRFCYGQNRHKCFPYFAQNILYNYQIISMFTEVVKVQKGIAPII